MENLDFFTLVILTMRRLINFIFTIQLGVAIKTKGTIRGFKPNSVLSGQFHTLTCPPQSQVAATAGSVGCRDTATQGCSWPWRMCRVRELWKS